VSESQGWGGPGSAPDDDGWGTPSLYGKGLITIEPRMFTEINPVPSVAMPAWQQQTEAQADAQVQADARARAADQARADDWGAPTHHGPRRLRPRDLPLPEPAPTSAPAPVQVRDEPAHRAADDLAEESSEEDSSNRGLLASSRTMAIASLASRITGFLRTVVIVAALGAGAVSDSYNSANSFPNMVYELLLGGVLSSVLIPLLVNAQERDSDRGKAYTQRLLSIATALLGITTLLAVAAAPLLARAFADPSNRSLTSTFATLLLPEIFFYGLGAMFTAILNIRGVYGPGAWAPVLNNMITIVAVGIFLIMPGPKTLTAATITTPQILVIGIGTTLGIVAQATILIPALRRTGFRWQWRFRAAPNEKGRMKEAGTLVGWVLGYVVASQVGVSVILKVALNLGHGPYTEFTNADLLFQVPYGVLGVSLLTGLMPRMSRAASRGDNQSVIGDLALGARLSAIGLLPITALLIALGPSFTLVIFQGRTSQAEARLIGTSLAMAAFGLLPFALVMLQLRVFYAMRDARTPTLINIAMVATKVVLVLLSSRVLHGAAAVEALNVSTSISYVVGAVAGHLLLTRRFGRLGFAAVAVMAARVALAAVVGGVAAYVVVLGSHSLIGTGRTAAAAALVVGAVFGFAVFGAVASRLRIPELEQLTDAIKRRAGR
jgi:putative peptidoglycan lipid II flippase